MKKAIVSYTMDGFSYLHDLKKAISCKTENSNYLVPLQHYWLPKFSKLAEYQRCMVVGSPGQLIVITLL